MPTHEVTLCITLITSTMISISGPYIKMNDICYALVYSIGATGSGTGPASSRPSSLCSSSDGPSTSTVSARMTWNNGMAKSSALGISMDADKLVPPFLSGNLSSHSRTDSFNSLSKDMEDIKKMIMEESGLDILSCLHPADLTASTKYAREAGLIPQYVMDDLKIMHSSISHELRCRYLMLHISKIIREGYRQGHADMMDRFINLFCRYLNMDQVKQFLFQHSHDLSKGMRQAQVFKFDIGPETSFGLKSHLGRLYEKLSDHSHLWDKIGGALGFTDDSLKRIKVGNSHDEIKCLHSLLHRWLSEKYSHVKLPLFKNLHDALCSDLVGLEGIANKLKEIFRTPAASNMKYDKSYVCNDDRNIQIYTSCGTTLKENDFETAVLLEVRVKFPSAVSLDHEWYKNGEPLICADSVLNTSILCVRLQDILGEGDYACMCTLGDEVIESDTIVIRVETLLCKYRTQLSDKYKSQPQVQVEEHAWPDVQQDTYINLAVIGGKGRMSNKRYQQTIRGDADDVLTGSKATIEYRQAFQDINHGNRVLVVGRPGSGKTTLVHRVSQDWAHGLMLGLVKALFLIYLRGFHSNPGTNLKSLMKCYFNDEEDTDVICKYICERRGLGVCFILDGLDEYQPEMDEDAPNFIFQLIRGDVLPRAVVIVASRPAAVAMFTKVARRHVEVLGFFKQQVEEYIYSYEFDSDLKHLTLKKYLEHHPNVHHMCYLPIQTAMICFLFDVCEDKLPNTETGIYTEFTKQTVLRALYRRIASRHKTVLSLEHLDKKEKDIVFQICKLAFEMTRSSKQVIQQEEVKAILKADTIDESLGLITVDWKATICGFQNLYSFCHLTFQEFLSAYHISRLEVQEQLAIIQSCGPMKHMYMVFKFYCGLVKFEEDCGRFKELLEVAEFETLHKLHCCFESQQPATCDFVTDRGMIDGYFTTPSDYTCLGYVVVNAKKNIVRMIGVEDVDALLNEECVEAFIKATNGTRRTASPVELLSFEGKFSEQHLELMRACPSLLVVQLDDPDNMVIDCTSTGSHPSLDIVCISISETMASYVKEELMKDFKQMFPNVRYIGVCGYIPSAMQNCSNPPLCPFSSVYCMPISSFSNGAFQRAEVLSISYDMRSTHLCCHDDGETHYKCLCTRLYIFNCNINNPTAVLLTEGVKWNISLEVLKLVANSIGDEGAVAIADSIKCCSSLHWLDLSLNRIGDEGAAALVSSLDSRSNFKLHLFGNCISASIIARVCSKNNRELLQTLDITDCIGDVGLACIDSLMKEWTPPLSTVKTLHTLYLQSCNNSPDGFKCVASILSRFTSLQSVSLIDMNICDEGVRLLSDSLQWHCISVLILSHNRIGDDGARAIADALLLSVQDLSGNGIQDAGTEALSEALRSCKLQRLSLASNCIGPSGALAVAGVLKHVYKSLDTLDLSCNRLGDVGAVCLAGGLKHCSCLNQLHLNCNFVGDGGAMALARCLQTCNQLTTLNLSDNEIGDSGALSLGNCLKDCSCLHTLRLNNNLISGYGAVGVAEGVKHCRCLHTLEIGWNFIFLEDVNTMVCTLKNYVNLRRLFVAKHDYIKEDVFINTEFLPIDNLPPQCDIIMELCLKDDGTYEEINYSTSEYSMRFAK